MRSANSKTLKSPAYEYSSIKGFNARKRLCDGTDGGFAPLPIGTYTAKPTEDGHLAIEKRDGSHVYIALSTLEEGIAHQKYFWVR